MKKIENLDNFLVEIGQAKLLSEEEELELLKAVNEKGSDCDELERLCWASMRLVVSLVRQYQKRLLNKGKRAVSFRCHCGHPARP